MFFNRILLVAGLMLWMSGCARGPARPDVVRVVLLAPQDVAGAATEQSRMLRVALLLPFTGLADAMVFSLSNRRQAADVSPHFIVEPQMDGKGIVLVVFDGEANRHLRDIECRLTECAAALGAAIGVTPRQVESPAVNIPLHPSEEQLAALARQFPGSALVYEEWMNLLAGRGEREAAGRVAAEALRRPWPALEKAQFEVAAATMRGDAAGRLTAVGRRTTGWRRQSRSRGRS